jgi:hypothetical protein
VSLLTGPEVAGVTPDMPPLTDLDVHAAIARTYSRDRADATLAGHRNGRSTGWGYAGREDGVWVSTHSDAAGIWARVDDRGGRISWSVAEAVLHELYPSGQLDLFDLAVSA